MNKNVSKNSTFVEKLKRHTKLNRQIGDNVKSLSAKARKAIKDDNQEKADKLFAEAELLLETTDRVLREFEADHSNEFSKLKSILNK